MTDVKNKIDIATIAGGCFWCTEAIFKRVKGVLNVLPGYSGGSVPNPSYEQVSSGDTGHAEAIQIEFDTTIVSYSKLLDVFFAIHDPTTKNRQGADVGTQYRSVIFYHSQEQKKLAEDKINELNSSEKFQQSIVTEIIPFNNFYIADERHLDFYARNPNYGYCRVIIDPKIQKLLNKYNALVKDEYI